jgi:hypothetical protein
MLVDDEALAMPMQIGIVGLNSFFLGSDQRHRMSATVRPHINSLLILPPGS